MAEEGMGRPLAEGDSQVAELHQFLQKNGIDEDIDIQNVLVFTNPRAELSVTDQPRPIVTTKGLKKALARQPAGKLPADRYQQLQALFDAAVEQQR
jgi:hypothetical protein